MESAQAEVIDRLACLKFPAKTSAVAGNDPTFRRPAQEGLRNTQRRPQPFAGGRGMNEYEHAQKAAAHRRRAEKLRTIASTTMDEAGRKELFRIAVEFERLALTHEQRAALKP